MCGRYTQTLALDLLMERFGFGEPTFPVPPRYNIAPTQEAPVVVTDGGERALRMMQWGLRPSL